MPNLPNQPAPGTFTLHSRAVPPLPAGSYLMHAEQTIAVPGADVEQLDTHLEVTAPRYVLPPDQILSTFPPNKAEGEFSTRLPQIVLKRRTLPWERSLDGQTGPGALPRSIPWLALVVLADAECQFKTGRPIAECVTPGVVLPGTNDATVGNAIVVTDKVVQQVFPNKVELPLLAHVRNVDLSDTELALGDDDGWLAVLFSNRLPQPGMQYRACLISLEGQYDALPEAGPIEDVDAEPFNKGSVYPNKGGHGPGVAAARSSTPADGWSLGVKGKVSGHGVLTTGQSVGGMHTSDMSQVDPGAPQFIFPVLAQWQFTCRGDRDFESLMRGLDVGMLGTLPPAPAATQPGQKPPPPPSRPAPEVIDTGHIALDYVSRAGEDASAWYRGPLVPRPTTREQPDATGMLPLLHSSDQARRIGPDGRENLSLAAAFEIGRLLALAEPGVVAALLNWRKQGFEETRQAVLLNLEPTLATVAARDVTTGFAARAGLEQLVALGQNNAARFGSIVPLIALGRPIAGIDDVDLPHLLATGLGVSIDVVRDILHPGVVRSGGVAAQIGDQVTALDEIAAHPEQALGPLRQTAVGLAADIAGEALTHGGPR
jgi:hypothetical protein